MKRIASASGGTISGPTTPDLGIFAACWAIRRRWRWTATATDRVRRDIIEQLELREPRTFVTGFARPNLFYEVQSPRSERQKPDLLVDS